MSFFKGIRRVLAPGLLLAAGLAACNPPSPNAEANKAEGARFLQQNRETPGVQATASGLQYLVLTEGTGTAPKATDMVTVNYRGSLVDGRIFDHGEGVRFPLNGVIPGWTEGLQLMKEGGSYRFFIPSELAYGERGAGQVIPPNSTLIFDVELVKVGPS